VLSETGVATEAAATRNTAFLFPDRKEEARHTAKRGQQRFAALPLSSLLAAAVVKRELAGAGGTSNCRATRAGKSLML